MISPDFSPSRGYRSSKILSVPVTVLMFLAMVLPLDSRTVLEDSSNQISGQETKPHDVDLLDHRLALTPAVVRPIFHDSIDGMIAVSECIPIK